MPAADRIAWLDVACANQPELRKQVEDLLRSDKIDGFMESPPLGAEIALDLARYKPEEAGERIGKYKLLEQIGEGGFGTVWVADQMAPVRRRVAMKIIKLGMDTKEVIARFEQERQALAMMDHPNIAKVFDAGATQFGRPYFVMELVHGIKITDYCNQAKLPTRDRLELFVAVCHAVQHAHQKGIIHRDLKPSNILVMLGDGAAIPKVIDFGVAKATQQQRLTDLTLYTKVDQMVGTPLYMSPEQAEMSGLDIDTRSDIYSLGVLLYELLIGRTPFDPDELMRKGLDEIRRAIREQEPQKPSTAFHTMPVELRTKVARQRQADAAKLATIIRGDLDWIVMKAIEKDRTRRYETANGLGLDIQRFMADEPVAATPPSRTYRFRKFARRNKLGLSAAAAVIAALVIGLIVSLWQIDRREKAEGDLKVTLGKAQANQEKAEASEFRAKRFLYATDMNAAQQAVQRNKLGLARELLNRHRPEPGEPDLRGWEWRYLYDESRSRAETMLDYRPGIPVFSQSFSPDGTQLLIGYADGQVELWDAISRRRLRVVQAPSDQSAHVTFAPRGETFAASLGKGVVKSFNSRTGAEVLICTAKGTVRDLSYSPDNEWVAVLSRGPDHVAVVNAADGRSILDYPLLPGGGGSFFNNARISPQKNRMYVTCGAGPGGNAKLRCVSLPDGKPQWEVPIGLIDPTDPATGYDEGFSAMGLSPNGETLVVATGYRDPNIRVVDIDNGHVLRELKGHTSYVLQVAFSQDGKVMASTSEDQTIRLWDTATWTSLGAPLRGHNHEVNAVAFANKGGLLASGNKGGEVLLWNWQAGPPLNGRRELPPAVQSIVPLSVPRMVLARMSSGSWSLIDLRTMLEEPLPASELAPNESVPAIAPKRKRRSVPLGDHARWGLPGHLLAPVLSPDGKLLVVASDTGQIGFYDAITLKPKGIFRSSLPSIFGVAFFPNGKRLVVSSGGDLGVAIWDVDGTIQQELMTLSCHGSLLGRIEFSEDEDTLLIGSEPSGPSSKGKWQFWRAPSFSEIDAAERKGGLWPHNEHFLPVTPGPSLAETKALIEAAYNERLAIARANASVEPELINRTVVDLARLLRQQSRYAEAKPLLRDLLDQLKQRNPEDVTALLSATKQLLSVTVSKMQIERQASGRDEPADVAEADALVDDTLALLERDSMANPGIVEKSLQLGLLQAWFGKHEARAKNIQRLVEEAGKASQSDPGAIVRAVGLACLIPSSDKALFERALRLSKLAAAIQTNEPYSNSWRQLTLGLASFRMGDLRAAGEALQRAEDAAKLLSEPYLVCARPIQLTAKLLQAMVLLKDGKRAHAEARFAEAEAEMDPPPADNRLIIESGSVVFDLMVLIPHREAKALLQSKSPEAADMQH